MLDGEVWDLFFLGAFISNIVCLPHAGFTLYLANLPYDVTPQAIRSVFSKFGNIQSITAPATKMYGYVDFAEPRSKLPAILKYCEAQPVRNHWPTAFTAHLDIDTVIRLPCRVILSELKRSIAPRLKLN